MIILWLRLIDCTWKKNLHYVSNTSLKRFIFRCLSLCSIKFFYSRNTKENYFLKSSEVVLFTVIKSIAHWSCFSKLKRNFYVAELFAFPVEGNDFSQLILRREKKNNFWLGARLGRNNSINKCLVTMKGYLEFISFPDISSFRKTKNKTRSVWRLADRIFFFSCDKIRSEILIHLIQFSLENMKSLES